MTLPTLPTLPSLPVLLAGWLCLALMPAALAATSPAALPKLEAAITPALPVATAPNSSPAKPAVAPAAKSPAATAVAPAPTPAPGSSDTPPTPGTSAAGDSSATVKPETALTGAGQRIYERTRPMLLQVRTLLKTQDSQSSVGSGFLVDPAGYLITNYHVVSQYALQPGRHRLVYASVDGQQGALQLLAFDVVHDLALLRLVDPAPLAGRGAVALRPAEQPLPRGARIFSLGNPLDVGFAVAEGSYNGTVERSYLPTLFFGGSLSAGMSGGPALDEQGRLVGVNVAARRDGEQVSFLVPAEFVAALIERGRSAPPITTAAWDEITRQLMEHEAGLTQRFAQQPWRDAGHPHYRIPVPQETFMRCWGQGSPQSTKGLQFERGDCTMDSRIFVSGSMLTGHISVRHEAYDGSKLGPLRFAHRYNASFANEPMGINDRLRTASQCTERSVLAGPAPGPGAAGDQSPRLPLRAVVCLRALKKLPGLHDLSVLVASLDQPLMGVQGRLDAQGVSLASAQRLVKHYLDGFGLKAASAAGPAALATPPGAPGTASALTATASSASTPRQKVQP